VDLNRLGKPQATTNLPSQIMEIVKMETLKREKRKKRLSSQVDETRETITARAIKTPHLHFSQMRRPQVMASPGAGFFPSSFFLVDGLPGGGRRLRDAEGVMTGGDAADPSPNRVVEGCIIGEVGIEKSGGVIRLSAFPRSLRPILGRSRSSAVQYSGKASLKRGWARFQP